MNYAPNTKQWKAGDLVIHDADSKKSTTDLTNLVPVQTPDVGSFLAGLHVARQGPTVKCPHCGADLTDQIDTAIRDDADYALSGTVEVQCYACLDAEDVNRVYTISFQMQVLLGAASIVAESEWSE